MSFPIIFLLIISMQGFLCIIRIYWMLLVLDHLHVWKKKLNGISSTAFKKILKVGIWTKVKNQVQTLSMIALRLSLKLLIVKSCVINMVLILKFWQIILSPLLLILMLPKEIGTYIMNLLKILAWKMKLLLMIAIHMLKPLKYYFLISMLIFVECIDLVKRLLMKK